MNYKLISIVVVLAIFLIGSFGSVLAVTGEESFEYDFNIIEVILTKLGLFSLTELEASCTLMSSSERNVGPEDTNVFNIPSGHTWYFLREVIQMEAGDYDCYGYSTEGWDYSGEGEMVGPLSLESPSPPQGYCYLWSIFDYDCDSSDTHSTTLFTCRDGDWIGMGSAEEENFDNPYLDSLWCSNPDYNSYNDKYGDAHCASSPSSDWCGLDIDDAESCVADGGFVFNSCEDENRPLKFVLTTGSNAGMECCGDAPDATCEDNGGECRLLTCGIGYEDGEGTCGIGTTCCYEVSTEVCGDTICGINERNSCEPEYCPEDCEGVADTCDGGDDVTTCIQEDEKFYTEVVSSTKLLGISILSLDLPFNVGSIRSDKDTACCEDLEPQFIEEDSATISILLVSGVYTWDEYKCVEDAGFCLEIAQDWLGSVTNEDCSTNTIILIIGGLALLIVFSKLL